MIRNRVVVEVNPAFCELTGFPREQLLGARVPFPFWEARTTGVIELQCLISAGTSTELQASLIRRDGTRIEVLITAGRASPAGAPAYLCLVRRAGASAAELEAASVDDLSGLSAAAFAWQLEREVARARRHQRPLCVIVLGLDHPWPFEPRPLDPPRARLLDDLTRQLREHTREAELLARVAEEKFAWILPDADRAGASMAAERARRAIATANPGLTLSAGICELTGEGDAPGLYELADEALRVAHRRGGHQTVRHVPGRGWR